MENNLKLLAVAGGALVVMACQSPTAPNASLEQARFVYLLTLSDPYLAEHAATELKHARRTLRAAERVWSDGGDEATTRTLARMAARQVETARANALGTRAAEADDVLDADDEVGAPLREAAAPAETMSRHVPAARVQPITVSRSAPPVLAAPAR
jgi:hypothetical protein